jgi:hypothetical protein
MRHIVSKTMFYLIGLIVLLSPNLVEAQSSSQPISLFDLHMASQTKGDQIFALENNSNTSELRASFTGPQEPHIPQVEFYEFDKPTHLQGQVESLVHGIIIGLPPEYDHFGYEIRRHMKSIGNYDIYTKEEVVHEQLVNVKKARVIFKHWQDQLNKELDSVKTRIDGESAEPKTRTTYKVNAGHLRAFMIELQSWINANEAFLNFIKTNQADIKLDGDDIRFADNQQRDAFLSLYGAREKALVRMHRYDPFKVMVY